MYRLRILKLVSQQVYFSSVEVVVRVVRPVDVDWLKNLNTILHAYSLLPKRLKTNNAKLRLFYGNLR